jgi:hypothetical protein
LLNLAGSLFTSSTQRFNGNHIMVAEHAMIHPYRKIPTKKLTLKQSINGTFQTAGSNSVKFLEKCREFFPIEERIGRTYYKFPKHVTKKEATELLTFYKSVHV